MSTTSTSHLTAAQIRGARGLLNWSQEDLAEKSGLSVNTIRKLELGHISPRGKTMFAILHAFEDAGLEFLESEGVRHRPEDIKIYQGESIKDFYDDVYETAKKKGGETVIIHPSAKKYFAEVAGDYKDFHIKRMTAIKDSMSVKCLVTEDQNALPCPEYCEYRLISKNFVNVAPSYVYDDKYAIIILEAIPSPKIIVIQSRTVAEALRHQFYSLWDKAAILNTLDHTEMPFKKKMGQR